MNNAQKLFAGGLLSALLLAGCGGPSGPQRYSVDGTVTVNGAPLRSGSIVFTPTPETKGPAASASITDGVYRISAEEGLVPGEYRVEIQSVPDLGFAIDDDVAFLEHARTRRGKPLPAVIPPEFNSRSTLTAVVRAEDADNTFQFPIEMRLPRQIAGH